MSVKKMEIESEDKPPGSPLIRDFDIGNYLGRSNFFIKYEGSNPTGTQKDRISKKHVENAIDHGYSEISVATCGNYGASIAYYAGKYGIKAIVGIPQEYSNSRHAEIASYGADIIEKPVKYEEMVEYMREESEKNNWYDASPGSKNKSIDVSGYSEISYEIYNQLGFAPDYISIPVGNGTTFYGVYYGFLRLYRDGKIAKIPKFIAASTSGGNPVIYSFLNGFRNIVELDPDTISESYTNEPLVSYISYDGQKALDALYKTHGKAIYVSDEDMITLSEGFRKIDHLSVLPASASAAFAALKFAGNKNCVILLTGSDK
ncbi:pyridoxal-phosphate dependent enzyme [Ferroplasma sp.]|uniref:pyridoxal-phosphate dependent enzyme n=1 Tax=Ferroplasma sp. TaxID=2591003 RepID=UPI00307E9875